LIKIFDFFSNHFFKSFFHFFSKRAFSNFPAKRYERLSVCIWGDI
jgi:hypothetical protein